jgi:predicted acyltransferase
MCFRGAIPERNKRILLRKENLSEEMTLKTPRFTSVDAFRGLSVAAMIAVNVSGYLPNGLPQLRHAEWHGWTFADLVFPLFLFIVGISISLAFGKNEKDKGRRNLYWKILKRAIIIFALGLLLNAVPSLDFSTLRIPGVLQRIAVCYLFSALIYLHMGTAGRCIASALILLFYWTILMWIPVPGFGQGILDYRGNLVSYIDTSLLSGHLYEPSFDPEGITSTLPAIVTTLLGTLTGDFLTSRFTFKTKAVGLTSCGAFFVLLGLFFHPFFPINKHLWTSSFVIFSTGFALIILTIFYGIIEGLRYRKWAFPFLVLGTNALAVYVGSSLMVSLMSGIQIQGKGTSENTLTYISNLLFSVKAGTYEISLIIPLLVILICIVAIIPFYRKRIFIKV